MHYVVISGSHKPESHAQSFKISKWLADELEKSKGDDTTTDIISLSDNPYPLWDMSAWQKDSDLIKQMTPALDRLTKADGLIIVSPEYHGMAAPGLKNFLLYVSAQHVGHKPCLLVSVSASINGVYPITELHSTGAKSNRMVFIPDHLIVRNAEKVMNDHEMVEGEIPDDLYIKKRALYSLNVLQAYTKSLKDMRAKTELLSSDYVFGM
ncbi:MAG: NADPH-dependent FMN reductase [Alphaproteobacteria bacterium]